MAFQVNEVQRTEDNFQEPCETHKKEKKKSQTTGSLREAILAAADSSWSPHNHSQMTSLTAVSISFGKGKENPHLPRPLMSSLDSKATNVQGKSHLLDQQQGHRLQKLHELSLFYQLSKHLQKKRDS